MASASAIHDMSDTIVHLLHTGIPSAMVDPARIFLATPDEFAALQSPGQPHITIFLYRIAVNSERRNLPHRTLPNGQMTRASLPLELSYLVTAWAKETRDELSIIGQIAQTFYDSSELGAADLRGSGWDSDESVQLILESLPLEDHYRLWDAAEVPYRLSLTYVARVIGINPTQVVTPTPVVRAHVGATA